LAGRGLSQCRKFGAEVGVPIEALTIECTDAQSFQIGLDHDEGVHARAVVIAAGARYRKPDITRLEHFEGRGIYYVIDGNHRLARARRDSVQTVPSRRVRCPDHVPFLTSAWAYEKYVEYWNSKLEDLPHAKAPRKRRKGVA
jgi:hypothetical protein